MRLGEILVRAGHVTEAQLQAALARQLELRPRPRLGELLVREGLLREDQCAAALAEQFGLPHRDRLEPDVLDPQLVRTLPVEWARSRLMLPIRLPEGPAVALAEPDALVHLGELSLLVGQDLAPVLVPRAELLRALDTCYMQGAAAPPSEAGAAADSEPLPFAAAEDLLRAADQAPVTQRVNRLLLDAVRQRASDIHVEPFRDHLLVRFRVDGFLYEQPAPPKSMEAALISRLKIMAKLDIAERRLPQDGMATVRVGERAVDIRVSTVPVAEGERMVLRLLNREAATRTLGELGMPEGVWAGFRRVLREPSGIVLVTGPTGSGKTTTLYAAPSEIATPEEKIITIEDPVEYQIGAITQIPVNEKKGLTFARGLRSILRHDPDKIMVGEVRDAETAQIAVQAALTGHLVFTTVHANNVFDVIGRFLHMGLEPYNFVSALNCILAQRLVRLLCPLCRRLAPVAPALLVESGLDPELYRDQTFFEPAGCEECGFTGYHGRTAVAELLDMSDRIRELILGRRPVSEIKQAAREEGMSFLRESALEKVLRGETTLREINKVTFVQ